jgi:hypothetical protein
MPRPVPARQRQTLGAQHAPTRDRQPTSARAPPPLRPGGRPAPATADHRNAARADARNTTNLRRGSASAPPWWKRVPGADRHRNRAPNGPSTPRGIGPRPRRSHSPHGYGRPAGPGALGIGNAAFTYSASEQRLSGTARDALPAHGRGAVRRDARLQRTVRGLRGPGLRGLEDGRPFHAVRGPAAGQRYSLTFRMNAGRVQ